MAVNYIEKVIFWQGFKFHLFKICKIFKLWRNTVK